MNLSHSPEWLYLVRDFQTLYQMGSAGGSKKIRSHMKLVRQALGRIIEADPSVAGDQPADLPVCRHLDRALSNAATEKTASLARSLASVRPSLTWRYGYERVPRGLKTKYGYAEVLGPTGPVVSDELILGFVLFAPKTTYPAHSHTGITESYICVSGYSSENDVGVYAPGSLIFNPPGQMHRITTADREPCLLAYSWIGDSDALTHQKMTFSRAKAG